MTKFPSSAATAANNPYPHSDHSSEPPRIVGGIVQHALLSPTTQVAILAVVDKTGSASVGDIAANLPGHPDPVGAEMALVSAGILAADIHSVLDANTILRRIQTVKTSENTNPSTPGQAMAQIEPCPAEPDTASLPESLRLFESSALTPIVIVGPGDARRQFGRVDLLHRPGIYCVVNDRSAYVGMGSDNGARLAMRQLPFDNVETVFAIVDGNDDLSVDDALVLERMLWSRMCGLTDFNLVNKVPDGTSVDPKRYRELDAFLGAACAELRRQGVLFSDRSLREVVAGPLTEPERVAPIRALTDIPPGEPFELAFGRGLHALAVRQSEDRFLLLQGSDVRTRTVSSCNVSVSFLRAAWLHAGLLKRSHESSNLVVVRDLVFESLSAITQFATGSKGRRLDAWNPVDPDDSDEIDTPLLR